MLAELKSCSFDELKEVPEVVERLMQEATSNGEEIIYTKAQGPFSFINFMGKCEAVTGTVYEFATASYGFGYIVIYRAKVIDETGELASAPVMLDFSKDEIQSIVDAARVTARKLRPAGNCREILGSSTYENERKEA